MTEAATWGPPKVLLDALASVPSLDDAATLGEFVRLVERRLGTAFTLPESARRRTYLNALLMAVLEYPGGLQVIGSVAEMLEGEARHTERLRTAIAVAEVPLFTHTEWSRLMTLLGGLDVPDVARVYQDVTRYRAEPPPAYCTEPWLAVLHCATLNARPGEPLPCVLLVERLARYAEEGRREALLEWVADHRGEPREARDGLAATRAVPGGPGTPRTVDHSGARASVPGSVQTSARTSVHDSPRTSPRALVRTSVQASVEAGAEARVEAPAPASVEASPPVPAPASAQASPPASVPGSASDSAEEAVWEPGACLLVRLRPLADPDHERERLLSYWWRLCEPEPYPVRGGDMRIDLDDLPHHVQSLVEQAETGWAYFRTEELTLEFLLPRELLHLPVEHWAKRGFHGARTSLGEDHPVLLRSLERMERPDTHGRWRRRWDALAEAGAGRVHWFPDDGRSRLLADPPPAVVVLSGPPRHFGAGGADGADGADVDGAGVDELGESLRAGVPIVLWDRRGGTDPVFRGELADLMAHKGIRRLPEAVRSLRVDARDEDATAGDSSTLGRHVALLWDDPYRRPGGRGAPVEPSARRGRTGRDAS
ncbi:hypothetical protein ACFVIM_19450 [Streptomyces sp. NPDC057638]|uniref:VMAP-C domain-containing protein n=1 Tax=Streptomyces sp. NPDC057638 TaxID=3346190 RepID=UPI0036A68DDE